MWLKDKVEEICRRYDTRDPFEIADQRNVIVLYEPLGTIRGFYNRSYRQQFIHINQELEEPETVQVCAHELAHSIIHPKLNTAFLRENTFFSIDRLEKEAKQFSILLLHPDEDIEELREYTVPQIARYWGVDEDAVQYWYSCLSE